MTTLNVAETLDQWYRESLESEGITCVIVPSPFTDIVTDKYMILIRDADDVAELDRVVDKAVSSKKSLFIVFVGDDPMKAKIQWIGKVLRRFYTLKFAILPKKSIVDFVKMIAETENASVSIPKKDEEMMVSSIADKLKVNQKVARTLRVNFKNLEELKSAGLEKLTSLDGIVVKLAEKIIKGLKEWKSST